ncbi:hypothetical protein [Flavobacterium sp. WC2509]|uniref:hypothetical protein n=1 Tax=Flavobacterium sp. WC2509 TaxID=3461406 RepID=UPI004043DFAB
MKKLIIYQPILCCLFAIFGIQSCTNQEKENNNSILESTKEEPTIDFNLIDCLNEYNQKNIKLSDITFDLTKDVKTLQLLLKIKKNHQDIDSELKKLTKQKLIIIPKIVYQININPDSIKGKKATLYLLKKLKNQIETQISLFDSIEKNSQNTDFKILAIKSRKILENNNNVLNTLTYLK